MDKNYIADITQVIINSEFNNEYKRKINSYHDRLNFACPYCGDSHSNQRSKRGNIWFNRLFYVCFNCDRKTTFDKFCKDFNILIDPDKKLEIIEHLSHNVSYDDYNSDFIDSKLEDLITMEELDIAFNIKKIAPIYDFSPIKRGGGVYKYLLGRGITDDLHQNIYQAKFSKGDEGFEHIIVLLNRRGENVIGLQVRNLKQGRRRFFNIYNWERLYQWTRGEEYNDLSKIVMYNKLSYYFNIMNVDLCDVITVFEGYLDSLFFPNSIGVVGVNTDLRMLEDSDIEMRYFYDNDNAGHDKSEEKLREGKSVFLWNKLFEDVINRKGGDPYKLHDRIMKIKDLNKLAEIFKNPFEKLNLDHYFSNDIYDLRYLPKKVTKVNSHKVQLKS